MLASQQEVSELKARAVAGSWGRWSAWSDCTQECRGTERRERHCDSPVPTYGGASCDGDQWEERTCYTEGCQPGTQLHKTPECQCYDMISGLIITGGSSSGSKVELYNPVSGSSCSLPDLPDERSGHHQCGDLLCSATSCLVRYNSQGALFKIYDFYFNRNGTTFSRTPITLPKSINDYMCWTLPRGGGELLLLLGRYQYNYERRFERQTTIVSSDGTSARSGWRTPYATW